MKTTRRITIQLTPKELEEAVALYLQKDGYALKSITFDIQTVTTGYGLSERDEKQFTGATVEVTSPE